MRKLAGVMTLILVALLLAACGSDDDNGDATEEATTVADIATEESTEEVAETETVEATEDLVNDVAVSSPAATGTGGMASPVASGAPATPASAAAASPAAMVATPADATPATDAAIAPVAASGDDDAVDEATPAAADVGLTGRVELPGAPNEAWVMTSEGCVGLGANTSLKPGQQLVVRDADGAIVGVTMLAASDETDACAWDFSVSVPDSPFYEVSVPMAVEHVFTREDVEQSGGELIIPAG